VIGRIAGKYRILDVVGEGGMGIVYRAEHVVLGSPAAIKVLLPELTRDDVAVERLFNEAKATSAIRHIGIVQIFDFGRFEDRQAYISMELLRGEELTSFIGRHRVLDPAVAAQITLQTLSALEAAHLIGVIHRDLKPDNIFLVRDPGAPGAIRVKLLDFGIAKLVADQLGHQPTTKAKENLIVGTPAYMAPEQCRGGVEIDARADLYAVGCILFEMLTGRPPFGAGNALETMTMQVHAPAPRLRDHAPNLPPELDELLAKLLAKAPADRTPSAAWALAALERVPLAPLVQQVRLLGRPVTQPVVVAPPDPGMPRWIPIAVIAFALMIAAAAAFFIGLS
jgi:serine/threonine-protein kinase